MEYKHKNRVVLNLNLQDAIKLEAFLNTFNFTKPLVEGNQPVVIDSFIEEIRARIKKTLDKHGGQNENAS